MPVYLFTNLIFYITPCSDIAFLFRTNFNSFSNLPTFFCPKFLAEGFCRFKLFVCGILYLRSSFIFVVCKYQTATTSLYTIQVWTRLEKTGFNTFFADSILTVRKLLRRIYCDGVSVYIFVDDR